MRKTVAWTTAAFVSVGALGALAAAETERPGRYTMQPADGGVIRLDTETGAMALCTHKDADWSCKDMTYQPGEQQARITQLESENQNLKAEVKRLEESLGIGPPNAGDGAAPGTGKENRLELPSEQDVDKAIDYLGRMIKKFRDKLKEIEKQEKSGTPL